MPPRLLEVTDATVVGGGPAGAASAIRLAQLGHRVVLVERAERGRPHVGESLPPTVLPLLQTLGVGERVEAARFLRPRGAIVQWDGVLRDVRDDARDEPGFQVDRGRFDALLLDAACACGVTLLQPVAAAEPQRDGGAWTVPLRDRRVVRSRVVVDARGRRSMAGSQPATAALYAYWPDVNHIDPRTRVEASRNAWYWGAPLPDGSFNATVFIDAARCAGLPRAQRALLYRELLAESTLLRKLLNESSPDEVQVCDASVRTESEPAPDGLLRVGEAAFTIDALSSQGVQAALRSGIQAAVCAHTMLQRPSSAALAHRFHAEQATRTARHHAQVAQGFYAAAARHHGSAFWQARVDAGIAPRVMTESRAWPALDAMLTVDSRVRWTCVPALDGEWIALRDAIDHPSLDGPASFIAGMPVSTLLTPLRSPIRVAELLRLWSHTHGDERACALLEKLWRQELVGPAA